MSTNPLEKLDPEAQEILDRLVSKSGVKLPPIRRHTESWIHHGYYLIRSHPLDIYLPDPTPVPRDRS